MKIAVPPQTLFEMKVNMNSQRNIEFERKQNDEM